MTELIHPMDSDLVLTHISDGVLHITLNRPDVLNSFNSAMATALLDALRAAAEDVSVRAVLLTARGRAFCAGQDLADVLPAEGRPMPDLGDVVRRQYNPIIRAIRTLEKPVVCAVNGVAAGAGANIAFACDITLAADDATFIQSFAKIGLIPDSGGTFILPRLIGFQRAAALTIETCSKTSTAATSTMTASGCACARPAAARRCCCSTAIRRRIRCGIA